MAASPVWMPMRTRSSTPSGHSAASSARRPSTAATTASFGFRKTKKTASPWVPNPWPRAASAASHRSASWRASTSAKPSFRRRSSAVEPSTSVKRNVTVPVGRSTPRIQPDRGELFDRQACPQRIAALGPRACLELAAVHGDPLAHADEAVSALVAVAPTGAVVHDRQLDVAVAVADEHLGVRRARVLERVREPFLDEPVGGQVDTGGKRYRLSLDAQLHREPGLARLHDQALELLEGRLRGERGRLLGPPEDADHPPHLRERLTARLLDDKQGRAFLLLVGLQEPPDRGGLHGHDADAVADDVVELARDPRALLANRQARPLLPFPLGACRPLLRLVDLPELAADGEADGPGDREGDDVPDEVTDLAPGVVVRDDRRDADRERQAGDRLEARPAHAEEDAHGEPGEESDDVVGDDPAVDERARADRDADRDRSPERKAPACKQRSGEPEDG